MLLMTNTSPHIFLDVDIVKIIHPKELIFLKNEMFVSKMWNTFSLAWSRAAVVQHLVGFNKQFRLLYTDMS